MHYENNGKHHIRRQSLFVPETTIKCMIDSLADQIFNSGIKFAQIVGIANGGLNISIPLSKILKLPHTSVRISHYDGHIPRKIPVIDGELNIKNNLIVDDMTDGGFTLKTFDRVFGLEGNKTAVLFWNKYGGVVPDFYAAEKPNSWIVFPWSKE